MYEDKERVMMQYMETHFVMQDNKERKKINEFLKENHESELNNKSIVYSCSLDNKIIGVSVLDLNPLHPHAYHLRVFVDPKFRQQGIGTKMVAALKEKYNKPYRVGVDSEDKGAINFIKSLNFKRVTKCYLPEYQKGNLRTQIYKSRNEIQSVHDLNVEELDRLKWLLHDNYSRNHTYNPLGETIDYLTFAQAAMSEHESKKSFVIKNHSKIIGYLISFPDTEKTLEIGYIGKDQEFKESLDGDFYTIIHDLFFDYDILSFEVDDVNEQGMKVLNLFDQLPTTSWDIYFDKIYEQI